MSRPFKHPKTGMYWFRKRVPADLVEVLGRREVNQSLDTRDPAEAKTRYVEVLREHEVRWTNMRKGPRNLTEREAHGLAAVFYEKWLDLHRDNPSEEVLWHPAFYKALWTFKPLPEVEAEPGNPGTIPFENIVIPAMRRFCLVQAEYSLEHFGHEINDWNRLIVAKATAAAMQRAHVVLRQQAEGVFEPEDVPPDPRLIATANDEEAPTPPAARPAAPKAAAPTKMQGQSLSGLLEGWWREAKAAGRKPSTYESYRNTFAALIAFLGHNDARSVTRDDVVRFKDHRLTTPVPKTGKLRSAKTVKDSDLSGLKAVFGWGAMNGMVADNPALNITIRLSKPVRLRGKGFTDDEAKAILMAALRHERGNETARTAAAKRWVPWLCAFTGARVGEVAQLRKEDVYQRDGRWVIRITPEAGTVKTNEAREVVLHQQILSLGFPDFVQGSPDGHLFLYPPESGNVLGPLQGLKNRLAEFARSTVSDRSVAPNHGWRHRFKTVGMEAGIPPRILDAIQGQAPRSVADTYGEVTLRTMAMEIDKLPTLKVEPQ